MTEFASAAEYFHSHSAPSWRCIRCTMMLPSGLDGTAPVSCLTELGGCGRSRDDDENFTYFVPSDMSEVKVQSAIDSFTDPEPRLSREYRRFFSTEDAAPLEACLAAIATSKWEGDPLWLYVVGPPSSGKTELLRVFEDLKEAYFISSLTPNSLVSGLRDGHDLLPDLDKKTLVVKDFTMTLEMHRENRDALFGALRDAFDGKFAKAFGTVGRKEFVSHFNFVAAVTSAIEDYYSAQGLLGQRFLIVRTSFPNNFVADDARDLNAERSYMKAVAAEVFERLAPSTEKPGISPEYAAECKSLALEVGLLRTHVHRDGYTHDITSRPEPEGPARVANQFIKMGRGLAFVRGKSEVTAAEMGVVRRIAMDTVPSLRLDVLRTFVDGPNYIDNIARVKGLSRRTVERKLEDLVMLGVVHEDSSTKPYIYDLARPLVLVPRRKVIA